MQIDIGLEALPRPLSEPVPPIDSSLDALANDTNSNMSVKDFAHDASNEQTSLVPG
jgi:hypothetical protein